MRRLPRRTGPRASRLRRVMNSNFSHIQTPNDMHARSWGMRLIEPVVAIVMLYLVALATGDEITGNHAVLAIITFFISSTLFGFGDQRHMPRDATFWDFTKAALLNW